MTSPASPDPSHRTPTAPKDAMELRLRGLLGRMAAVLAALTIGAAALGLLLREPIEAAGAWFVDAFGLWGVALAFFVPDATGLPLPPEIATGLALAGGVPFWWIVAAGSTGSILGGCTAWAGAQALRRLPALHRRLEARSTEVHAIVARYGALALVLGAITPLPYSFMAWATGVLGMPFRTFLLISLLRIPRVAIYLVPMLSFGKG